MTEGDYEYEKMRCELLGLPPPEKPDASKEGAGKTSDESDDVPVSREKVETIEEVDVENEQLNNASGGLDELTSILAVTQKRLNKFKVVCGSVTNLLKMKLGSGKNSEATSGASSEVPSDTEETPSEEASACTSSTEKAVKVTPKGTSNELDMRAIMGSQIDKLDSLIEKAERADMSMSSQNKQMKTFLNK